MLRRALKAKYESRHSLHLPQHIASYRNDTARCAVPRGTNAENAGTGTHECAEGPCFEAQAKTITWSDLKSTAN
jgi:hypothetical protein